MTRSVCSEALKGQENEKHLMGRDNVVLQWGKPG